MIEVAQSAQCFEIRLSGETMLCHRPGQPLLKLGVGQGNFRMRHGSFRIRDKVSETFEPADFSIRQQGENTVIEFENQVELGISQSINRLTLFISAPDKYNRLWINLPASPQEAVFGCGEQYSVLNLRGRKVPLWCQEQGIGRGRDLITFLAQLTHGAGGAWHTTYFPQPTFLTSANRWCHVDGTAFMEFDFRSKNKHTLHVWEIPRAIHLGRADSPPEMLTAVTELIGRQPALPSWANDGIWLGVQGGRDVASDKLTAMEEAGGKVAALWCQDWQGIRMTSFGKQLMWDWSYDKDLYPDLPGWAEQLKQQGVRFLGYINPFLALEGELYKEASQRGYLVLHPDGGEYHVKITDFSVAMLDLSNPRAAAWIKDVIKDNLLAVGLSGWMADFGEYMPVDAVLHSGERGETFHNKYPVIWARINREAVAEAAREDVTFFSRAGYAGTSAHGPLIWAGDQLVNWSRDDGLASVIPAGISLGLSGIGHFHSDIGGYTTVGWIKRSKELFMRWAEHAAFTTVMRTHEGNRPDVNHQFDGDRQTLEHLAEMTKVHVALKPYIRAAMEEYRHQGVPLMRHSWLHYPEERELYNLKYQYLFGRDLLVAPVYKKRAKKRRLLLPRDKWVHLWSGNEYTAGWQTVPAPLGQPPVFYRMDSPWVSLFRQMAR